MAAHYLQLGTVPWLLDQIRVRGLEAFGRYYGAYRAEVVSRDELGNDGATDPMGRLQVRVPAFGDRPGTVARVAYPEAPMAGQGFGVKFLPPVGSLVWVRCENGKQNALVWTGSWWVRDALPDDLKAADAHGIQTPRGHQVILDETEDGELLRVKHLGGSMVEMDKDGAVRVVASSGGSIAIDKDGAIQVLNASGKTVVVGDGSTEAAPIGDTLVDLIGQLCDATAQITVGTAVGPSTPPVNVAAILAVKAQLQRALSRTVQVAK
jgi:hypothetical protein